MATKLENLHLEIKHCNNFRKWIPDYNVTFTDKELDVFLNIGALQVSTLFELAVANIGGFTVVSEDANDGSDGSEMKLSSVRTCSYGTVYSAPVTNIKNKTGTLRVQVYERKQDKFYYFLIPHWAHEQVGHKSNIEIPFELDGTPRKKPLGRKKLPNWWDFQVNSFVEVCQPITCNAPTPSYRTPTTIYKTPITSTYTQLF